MDDLELSENELPLYAICSPKENIVDLSTSLLGIFIKKHFKFSINKNGDSNGYLKPWDESQKQVKRPQFKDHFDIREDFACWSVSVESLKNLIVDFTTGTGNTETSHEVKCIVKHTPIVSNYWHFSIQWLLNGEEISSLEEKGKITRGWIRQMSHASRTAFKIHAKIYCPNPTDVPLHYYIK